MKRNIYQIQWDNFEIQENMSVLSPSIGHNKYYEFVTIDEYLKTKPLNNNELYGFFSPNFFKKMKINALNFYNFLLCC